MVNLASPVKFYGTRLGAVFNRGFLLHFPLLRYSGGGLGRGSNADWCAKKTPTPALPRSTGGGGKEDFWNASRRVGEAQFECLPGFGRLIFRNTLLQGADDGGARGIDCYR